MACPTERVHGLLSLSRYWLRTVQHIEQQKGRVEGDLKTRYAALLLPVHASVA
jgi:hypothetical protein